MRLHQLLAATVTPVRGGGPTARDAAPTRVALVAAAERLFAASGIEQVSLREISRASGARNAVALQYHFENRQGILRAVLAKHYPGIEQARHDLLTDYEAGGRNDVRPLSEALVLPLAAKLQDPDGGPEYLQINAELTNHPVLFEPNPEAGSRRSIDRWRALVVPYLAQDANRLHRRFTAIRFASSELGRRAHDGPHRDDRLFCSHLVDLVSAMLMAPVSDQTTYLATDRDRHLSSREPDREAFVSP